MAKDENLPLFTTKLAKGRILFQFYSLLIFVGICFIFVYRLSHIPAKEEPGRWAWMGLFFSELWFCFYWFVTTVVRWNPVYRNTFKDRLSRSTPPLRLAARRLYCSPTTPFSRFRLLPFRSPLLRESLLLYFPLATKMFQFARLSLACPWIQQQFERLTYSGISGSTLIFNSPKHFVAYYALPRLWVPRYPPSNCRIGKIGCYHIALYRLSSRVGDKRTRTADIRHRILIDGRESKAVDIQGQTLPTLVYFSREKRPQYHHHFKAGAMNALIRVSSRISNSPIILNVDCDMYSNNSMSVRDALCFFMDEEKGNEVGFIQFPQAFENLTKNDVYGSSLNVLMEMGLKYDCTVEDVLTGIVMQCRGWRSIYFNPERKGFLGVAPTTLLQSLVQHKRWSEGDFHIFASRHCPFVLGYKRIPLKLQLTYCMNLLWAANCLATLYYVIVPSLCLFRGISLFPEITNSWVLAFVFVIIVHRAYSLGEFVWFGGTFKGWWNDQRMWLYKRTTSYFFGLLDYILKRLGFTNSAFVITTKVADDDVSQRYEQEVMEFGTSSPMFTILATLALLNSICFVSGLKRVIADVETLVWKQYALQILLCGLLVFINLPIYQGLFFRKDVASLPTSVTYQSTMFALLACAIAVY
uniref:Cellulose synthase-like protein E6 n=3 Tax=fabids TaxID=91835 RepID=A0A7N2LR59_QUELO